MEIVGWETIQRAFMLLFSVNGFIVLILTFLAIFIGVWRWKMILKAQGYAIPYKSLVKFDLVGFAVSYLTPIALFGGEAFRIYFTKKKFKFLSWEKTIASVAIDKIIDSTMFLMFVIAGIISFALYGYFPTKAISFFVYFIVGGLTGLLLFFYFKTSRRESILGWFLKILGVKKEKIKGTANGKLMFSVEKEVFRFFSSQGTQVLESFLISFAKYLLFFVRSAFLLFLIKEQIGVLKDLVVYSFSLLPSLLPLPASLGGLEASEVFIFRVLGLGSGASGAVFSMVLRGADLLACLVGLFFFLKFGLKITETKVFDFFDNLQSNFHKKPYEN